MGPQMPMLIVGCCFLFYQIFSTPLNKLFVKCGMMKPDVDEEVDENLGTFFECVSPWESKRWIASSSYRSKKLGFKTVDSWTFDKLSHTDTKDKIFQGAVNYEMLTMYKYQKMYQYIPIEVRNTPQEQEVSDKLERLLFAGYLPKDEDFVDLLGKEAMTRGKSFKKKKVASE